jgi:osmoprotectant transport system substrate-binding protein
MKRLWKLLPASMLIALLLAGCPSGDNGDNGNGTELKGPITVSSKLDEEGGMLGQMIILMLEANGFDVVDKTQLGATNIVRPAIISGEIDIYPEYTGNGAFFFDGTDPDIWRDAQFGYNKVKELDKVENNIVWLGPAPANNTWAIAIPITLAQQENLLTLSDLSTYINDGGFIKLAASEEFVNSPAALPAFQEAYGFVLSQDQLVTFAGGDTAQTEQAASQGIDGVNAAMAFGTDGELQALGLAILEDPLGAQPIYEPAPIVRGVIFDQYPELATILNPVFATLDTETLQELNAKVGLEGQLPADVARDYLTEEGFL